MKVQPDQSGQKEKKYYLGKSGMRDVALLQILHNEGLLCTTSRLYNSLDKVMRFFERHGPPKLTQEIETLNILISVKEIKIKQKKLQVQMFSLLNSTKHRCKNSKSSSTLSPTTYKKDNYIMTKRFM